MDDLRDIALFVEVARSRSFRRAADRLGLPPSTLSRRIAALESGLGSPLFLRTTRRVDLTEAGTLFLARCDAIVDSIRAARDELSDLTRRPQGTLRLSLTADFGSAFLAPVIARFAADHPGITLQLDLTPRRADLLGDGIDIAFRMGDPDEPYLYTRRLLLAPRGLCASPAYLAHAGRPDRPSDLARHSCLALGLGDRTAWVLHRAAETEEVEVTGPVRANAPGMVLRLALEGVGIAALDAVLARPHLTDGTLVPVLPDWSLRPVPIHAVTATNILPLKTRLFLDAVQAALRASP